MFAYEGHNNISVPKNVELIYLIGCFVFSQRKLIQLGCIHSLILQMLSSKRYNHWGHSSRNRNPLTQRHAVLHFALLVIVTVLLTRLSTYPAETFVDLCSQQLFLQMLAMRQSSLELRKFSFLRSPLA